ncbi:hypothetical protein GFS31_22610 [Leptolyngbya sp. BL0902]|nr:hypothetical protein GFS31_22610 [Leptolyngbya sp. BL0902]
MIINAIRAQRLRGHPGWAVTDRKGGFPYRNSRATLSQG